MRLLLLLLLTVGPCAAAANVGEELCQKSWNSYKERLKKNPADDAAWMEFRVCAGELKRWNEAVEVALEARHKNPDRPEPHLLLGLAQMQQRNYERAVDHFDESIRLKHDQPLAYFQMGMAYLFLDQPTEAAQAAERAVELDPSNSAHHRQLAYAKLLLGDLSQAETSVKKALELDPDDIASYKILSKVYAKEGKTEAAAKAQEHLKQAEARYAAAHPETVQAEVTPAKPPEEEEKKTKEKEEDVDVIAACIGQWDKMKKAVMQGNLDQALLSYSDYLDTREQYRASFSRLGVPRLQSVFSSFGDLYDCDVVFASAHCKSLVKNATGTVVVTKIRFERNPDRVWRIRSF
jgi:tetratricopeptide (TPR) repeat protein